MGTARADSEVRGKGHNLGVLRGAPGDKLGTEKTDGEEVKGAWGLGDPKPALTSRRSRYGSVWISGDYGSRSEEPREDHVTCLTMWECFLFLLCPLL